MENTLKKNNCSHEKVGIAFAILFGAISSYTSSQAASSDFRDSLTSEPIKGTLARLHTEAEADNQSLAAFFDFGDNDEKKDEVVGQYLQDEATDYKTTFLRFESNFLSVTPEFGNFLYSCVRATNARKVVEFGTSFGVSAIYLAAALRDNGGGELISTELLESKALRARGNFAAAGVDDLIDVRVGDALETLTAGFGGKIDLVHLDGAPTLYLPVLKLLEPHLRTGAFVIAENAYDEIPVYLEYVRNPSNGYHSTRIQVGEAKENQQFPS